MRSSSIVWVDEGLPSNRPNPSTPMIIGNVGHGMPSGPGQITSGVWSGILSHTNQVVVISMEGNIPLICTRHCQWDTQSTAVS